jgi:hypothetical protein
MIKAPLEHVHLAIKANVPIDVSLHFSGVLAIIRIDDT